MTRSERGWTHAATVGVTLGGLVLVVLLVLGGYFGGWWLRTDIANRGAHLRRATFEQQTTYRDEMVRKIADVRSIDTQITEAPDQAPQLQAQRRAVVDIVCRDNTHINGGLDPATASFVERECQ